MEATQNTQNYFEKETKELTPEELAKEKKREEKKKKKQLVKVQKKLN